MQPLIVIAGPTGVGKSELAVRIAEAVGGEIVNYDSVQVYRGFDIGSAKPSHEMRERVPHHLFDVVTAEEEFNAADYGARARATLADIDSRGRRAVLVGGTFFYLQAVLSGLPEMPGRDEMLRERLRAIAAKPRGQSRLYRWLQRVDPKGAAKIAFADRHRVERALEVWITCGRPISSWDRAVAEPLPSIRIGLSIDRALLVERLRLRVVAMYDAGLVEETARLLHHHPESARPFTTIGYKEAAAVLAGTLTRQQAIDETFRRTKQYAKRQMTWLRSDTSVQWIDATDPLNAFEAAMRLIEARA